MSDGLVGPDIRLLPLDISTTELGELDISIKERKSPSVAEFKRPERGHETSLF